MAKKPNFTIFELYISGSANPRTVILTTLKALLVWYYKTENLMF